jgi:hypothetical protein
MISESFKILINKFIDNELSPDEKVQLDQALHESTECSNYYNEMLLLDKQLKEAATHTQTIDIAGQLISKIKTKNQKPAHKNMFQMNNSSSLLKSYRLRLAIAFVSGAAACLIILFSFFDFGQNSKLLPFDALTGAMVQPGSFSGATKILKNQQSTVEIYSSKLQEGFVQLDIVQNSTEIINVEFSFDAGNFQVYGLRPLEQGTTSSMGATLNSVIIKSSGNARFVFLLKQMNQLESSVTVKIFSEGGTILNNDILLFNNQ